MERLLTASTYSLLTYPLFKSACSSWSICVVSFSLSSPFLFLFFEFVCLDLAGVCAIGPCPASRPVRVYRIERPALMAAHLLLLFNLTLPLLPKWLFGGQSPLIQSRSIHSLPSSRLF